MSQTSEKLIKYFFVGNVITKKVLIEYPNHDPAFSKEVNQIFDRICALKKQTYDLHNKVPSSSGNYFFTVTSNDIFYLLIGERSFEERNAFIIIENVNKEKVYTKLNEKNELSYEGLQTLKKIIEPFQNINNTKIGEVNASLNDIKVEMRVNITKVIDNMENVKELEVKALEISKQADIYNDNALELKRQTCIRNIKITLIIVAAVILLILIIVVPLVVTSSNASSNVIPVPINNKNTTTI